MTSLDHDVEHRLLKQIWIRHLGLHTESVNMGGGLSVCACIWRRSGCSILLRESLEHLSSQVRKPSEVWQHYGVPKVSPWLDEAKPILWVFMSKQALKMWAVVPPYSDDGSTNIGILRHVGMTIPQSILQQSL